MPQKPYMFLGTLKEQLLGLCLVSDLDIFLSFWPLQRESAVRYERCKPILVMNFMVSRLREQIQGCFTPTFRTRLFLPSEAFIGNGGEVQN